MYWDERDGRLVRMKRADCPALRLFCFHHAGGSASFCKNWPKRLPQEVELVSVQLPGREQRFREPFVTDMATLVRQLVPAIYPRLDVPFAVFGHSLGAAVAYELVQELRRRGLKQPRIFFASGRPAPQFGEEEPAIHPLPEEEFCAAFLRRHAPRDLQVLFADKEIRQLFIPQLRADMELAERYRFDPARAGKLDCPLIALDCDGGPGSVSEPQLAAWGEHTSGAFRSYRFPGDHFFIASAEAQVLTTISAELAAHLR